MLFFWQAVALAQDTQQLIGQLSQVYTGSESGSGLIGGFSVSGIIGALIFSAIGFVAFMYGKSNALYKTLMIGLGLMIYPYFFQGNPGPLRYWHQPDGLPLFFSGITVISGGSALLLKRNN